MSLGLSDVEHVALPEVDIEHVHEAAREQLGDGWHTESTVISSNYYRNLIYRISQKQCGKCDNL